MEIVLSVCASRPGTMSRKANRKERAKAAVGSKPLTSRGFDSGRSPQEKGSGRNDLTCLMKEKACAYDLGCVHAIGHRRQPQC